METDDLIASLVARHRPVNPAWIELRAVGVVAVGVAATVLLIWRSIGFRGDLIAAVESGRTIAKYVFILMALALSGQLFVHMARPGHRLGDHAIFFALPFGFIVVAALLQVAATGMPTGASVLGESANWVLCMALVPLFGLVPLGGLLLVLRKCAPTDIAGAGFAAGVFAATIAASVYASHCPADSPVFVALWYPIAFIVGGLIGRWLAPMVVRW